MQLDVVIGNPPYNNDIYIPFVETGHNLASTCSVFITPAKWQAKGGKKNEQFRANIVPHMSKIVYYEDAKKIFDIALSGGVNYFVTDKNTYDEKTVTVVDGNTTRKIDKWRTDYIKMDMTSAEMSVLSKLIKYPLMINNKQIFQPSVSYFWSKNFDEVNEEHLSIGSGVFSVNTRGERLEIRDSLIHNKLDVSKYKLGCSKRTFENPRYTSYMLKPGEVMGRNCCILYIGTEEECKSADSFYSSKLVWWLTKNFFGDFGISDNANVFRFVPDPIAFDHIFTDEELYKKYNLTPEEINIIESVIKERK